MTIPSNPATNPPPSTRTGPLPHLGRRRTAITAIFFLTGFALASWVANIPTLQRQTGVSHAQLGTLLLLLGTGQVAGMQWAGRLSDRRGSRLACAVSIALTAVAVNLPGLATSGWQLGAALLAFGLGWGVMSVAANDQAVVLEQTYARPIMAGFHAFFSIGGATGAGLSALLRHLDASVHLPLAVAGLLAVALGTWSVRHLQQPTHHQPSTAIADVTGAPARTAVVRQAMLLGLMAFLLMLAEGTANDWSALQAVDHLAVPASAAALAYAAFSAAMTVGRLTVDRLVARIGPVALVRAGSTVAGVGMLVVVTAPVFALTLLGWVVFGLGLSGIVPQLFTAAGALPVAGRAVVISRVVGAGYVGLLAGPGIIGWVSRFTGLSTALVLPAIFCFVGAGLASCVRPRRPGCSPTP
ncbi:MFS transporter [Kineococcus gynurae]|uniref:MFS transporter n=1 Tax=Kineococcus gynurae TaxID=452979 RepID=A0ABV5LW71_9ACTN